MIKPKPVPLAASEFTDAFPASQKVYVDGPHGVRVPMREIALSGGEPPLRVYDTSGPQGHDVRDGLPRLRAEWILGRGDVEASTGERRSGATGPGAGAGRRNGQTAGNGSGSGPGAGPGPQSFRAKPGHRPTQLHYA
ncbi:MAG: hypothetical protein ACREKM_03195, partial [Longimicrobiales bacterium]